MSKGGIQRLVGSKSIGAMDKNCYTKLSLQRKQFYIQDSLLTSESSTQHTWWGCWSKSPTASSNTWGCQKELAISDFLWGEKKSLTLATTPCFLPHTVAHGPHTPSCGVPLTRVKISVFINSFINRSKEKDEDKSLGHGGIFPIFTSAFNKHTSGKLPNNYRIPGFCFGLRWKWDKPEVSNISVKTQQYSSN